MHCSAIVYLFYFFTKYRGLLAVFEFFVTSKDVSLIAPDPISNMKPIVRTTKNKIATEKPNKLTWYKVTAKGYNNSTSRSNIKNNKQTIKKWIWNVPLVWPGITLNPHFN